PSQLDFANLREDVRGLTQRVGELTLRIEQLERENAELKSRASTADRAAVTLVQLNEAISDANRETRPAIAAAKNDTLAQVAGQLEKLAKQTQAALDALAKNAAPAGRGGGGFSEDYPKEGVSYVV